MQFSLKLKALLFALATILSSELILGIQSEQSDTSKIIGRSCILLLTIYTVFTFIFTSRYVTKKALKDYLTAFSLIFLFIVIFWLAQILLPTFATFSFLRKVNVFSVLYASVPFAIPCLLIHATHGFYYSSFIALITMFITTVYSPNEPMLGISVFISSLVGCITMRRVRSRSAFARASIWLGAVSFAFGVVRIILSNNATLTDIIVLAISALIGTLFTFLLSTGFIPILESVGGYVTDMRLIEIATFDHPILKELSIQAPGTWNHSIAMGMMAEIAADAIGANPVVARVGSYFHDIGKIKKPLYFIENQMGAENKHDKLPASMSALIIKSHVKDGKELGLKHKLPEVLIDMIEQHHGTSKIDFFYQKAIKEAEALAKSEGKPEVEIDITNYMYGGPKPQTKEAGIIMLADGIESASRVLAEPTPDRIQGMVQKKINAIFASGQLDECELTLKDLHKIAKSFTKVLSGILHHRVSYGEPVEKVGSTSGSEANAGAVVKSEVEKLDSTTNKSDTLKRLGN